MNFKGPDTMHGKSLHSMDTASLRTLLMMEMSADGELDVARIQEITDILAERESVTVMDEDTAWNDFQQNYISSEPIHTLEQDCMKTSKSVSKRKVVRRSGFVAAMLAALLIGGASFSVGAANFNIFQAMAKWTSETFGFTFGDVEASQADEGIMLENEELAPLWNAMIESGISNPQLPTDLPDGFEQIELTVDEEVGCWSAIYQSGEDIICIQVQRTQSETWSELQKDIADPKLYMWNDMEFYIMTNMEQSVVTWSSGRYEYYLSGASEPEFQLMIESVHKEGP